MLRKTVIQELWEGMRWARHCSDHVWECDEHSQPKKYADRILRLVAEAVEGMPIPENPYRNGSSTELGWQHGVEDAQANIVAQLKEGKGQLKGISE